MTRNQNFVVIVAAMLLVAAMNLFIAFNNNVSYLNYFGYEIQITPMFRLMCLFGGISMTLILLVMTIWSITDKVKKIRVHSVSKVDWDKGLKVSPELQEKVEKADSMSLDELEHLSDKKD